MLDAPAIAPPPMRSHSPVPAVPPAAVAVAAAAAVAFLPLLVRHAAGVWLRPHYQFFPLALAGAAVLAYARLRPLALRPGNPWLAGGWLAAGWLLLAAAEVLGGAWVAAVGAVLAVPGLVYAAGGGEAVRRGLPAWLLLALTVPPPMNLDRELILRLQAVTTGWSSGVLDALGVFHARAGNVIEVDGRNLLVEQACSGVNSLFSLLAVTVFAAAWFGRGWVRGGLLLAAAVGWVLAANVARVVGVVVLDTRYGVDVSTGWRHDGFGVALFAGAVGLLWSTDQLLGFLLGPTSPAPVPAAEPAPAPAARRAGLGWLAGVFVPAFLVLFAAHWALAEPAPAAVRDAAPVPEDAELLPPRLGEWQRQRFDVVKRDAQNFFGERSHVWVYARGGRAVLVSLDFPFPGWHDLTWCYTGQGWEVGGQGLGESEAVPGGFVEARLTRPVGRHGLLLVCEFDRAGRPYPARPGGAGESLFRHRAALDRLRGRVGLGAAGPPDPPGPAYQLQAFAEGTAAAGPAETVAVRDLFTRARAALGGTFR